MTIDNARQAGLTDEISAAAREAEEVAGMLPSQHMAHCASLLHKRLRRIERALAAQPADASNAAAGQGIPVELRGISETVSGGRGFWASCTGCYDTEDGSPTRKYAHSKIFGCELGSGCSECGGLGVVWDDTDYEEMARFMADTEAVPAAPAPKLRVFYGPMPESNGKHNYTAILYRDNGNDVLDLADGITIERSEFPDRVRYEADRVRYLLGELADSPDILDYDADKHSGYVAPATEPFSIDGCDYDDAAPELTAQAGEPPFTGHWRGGNGVISCGTLRIFSENFDTNPADHIRADIVKWVCDTLNAAQHQSGEAGADARDAARWRLAASTWRVFRVEVVPGITLSHPKGIPFEDVATQADAAMADQPKKGGERG